MNSPVQITFRGMEPSEFVAASIRERAARLERFNDQIIHCHVVVELPHRHQRKGQHFAVRIDLATSEGTIVVARDPSEDASHENFNAVVRDAFDAAVRQLEDESRRRRAARHG